jgi:dihydroorotase
MPRLGASRVGGEASRERVAPGLPHPPRRHLSRDACFWCRGRMGKPGDRTRRAAPTRLKGIPAALLVAAIGLHAQAAPKYDLLLRGGHVIDPRNNVSAVRDVAVSAGKVAAIMPKIDPIDAAKVVDVPGLYVTPGIVDIHTHVYAGTGERGSYAGDNSVYPDVVAPRSGVTTVADAGGSGWRSFEDFKQRIIDRSTTRVLAFLNIVGHGMRGGKFEQDLQDMAAQPTADMARKHPALIVGIKTAHYGGPEWAPVERSVEAGKLAGLPVMVDFGSRRPERPLAELVTNKLRAGDIYTHMYSGLRGELEPSGTLNPALWQARKRGVLFDTGHGARSFVWRIAVPAVKEGFLPDTISTDIHVESMSGGMKDMPNVLSKFLALGVPLDEVVRRATWNAARAIRQESLGHLSAGANADIAVFRLEKGNFGFVDGPGNRMNGGQKLICELTLRDGKVVYDLNGLAAQRWAP